jgi:hypothetical protein
MKATQLLTSNKIKFILNGAPISHVTEFLMRGASDSLVFYVELVDHKGQRDSYVIESIETDEVSPFVEFHLKKIETMVLPTAEILDFKKIKT